MSGKINLDIRGMISISISEMDFLLFDTHFSIDIRVGFFNKLES